MLAIGILKETDEGHDMSKTTNNTEYSGVPSSTRGNTEFNELDILPSFTEKKPDAKKEGEISSKLRLYKFKKRIPGMIIFVSHICALFLIRYIGKHYIKQ